MDEGKILKFIWKIENYSFFRNKAGEFLQSPRFGLDIFRGSEWCLTLYPRGDSTLNEKFVGIFLKRLMSKKDPVEIIVDFDIAIQRLNGEVEYKQEIRDQSFREGDQNGIYNIITCEELLETKRSVLLPRDVLTVECQILPKNAEMKLYTEVTAKTYTEIERLRFHWESEEFTSESEYVKKYELKFERNKKCFKMDITLSTGEKPSTLSGVLHCEKILKSAHCKICLLDSNKAVLNILANDFVDFNDDLEQKPPPYSIPFTFTIMPEILENEDFYFPNSKLNLLCVFSLCHGFEHSQIETIVHGTAFQIVNKSFQMDIPPENTKSSLISDFGKLYQEGALCDFTLKVGSTNLEVHKAVLCARSPIFKSMLTGEMKEESKNMLEILDLEVDTVQRMLTYIYTNFVDDLDCETAYKLYIAAEKFGLMGLKHTCLKVIQQNISVNNVRRILALANTYAEKNLREVIIDFISKNEKDVMCSEEWKSFMKEDINSATEIMQDLISRKTRVIAISL